MRVLVWSMLVIVGCSMIARNAWAICSCGNSDVTDCCAVTEVFPAAFSPAVSPFTTDDVWTTTMVTISCSCDSNNPIAVVLAVSGGQSADPDARQMLHTSSPSAFLDYHVADAYSSATEWGDGITVPARTVMVTRSSIVTLYLRIPSGIVKQALVGSYQDEVRVKVLSASW